MAAYNFDSLLCPRDSPLAAAVSTRRLLPLLRLPRPLHRVPRLLRQVDEVVELPGAAEPLPAVDRDALAVHELRPGGDQVHRQVRELPVRPEPVHRVLREHALLPLLARDDPGPRALRRE